jgi:hypothetical protein
MNIKIVNNHNNREWTGVERLYVTGFLFHAIVSVSPQSPNYVSNVVSLSSLGKVMAGEADADTINNNPDLQAALAKVEEISQQFYSDGLNVFTALDKFIESVTDAAPVQENVELPDTES